MEKQITFQFLGKTHLVVIASWDDKVLQDFLKCLSEKYHAACEKPIAEYHIEEIVQCDWSNTEFVIVKGVRNPLPSKRIETTKKLKSFKELAKANNAHCIVPLEQLECAEHLVAAQLRSIFLRIPEIDKPDIQMFKLHYWAGELRLECEFGENAGRYVVYDYDPATGIFRERK